MRCLLAAAMILFGATSALGQSWPAKQPVRIIVPVTAGSAMDIVARTLGEQLSTQLGQTFVVENRTGAGGTIGAAYVAKADPDGYTLLVHTTAHTISPSTFTNLPYDTGRDFTGVLPFVNVPLVLIVSPDKHKSLADLVATAKARPGSINYATVGYGAAAHLTAERFRLSAGFEAQQIPFKGAPEAITEVMAGRVDFFFSPTLPTLPLLREGTIKALAVSSKKRASSLPDVPTTEEAGFRDSYYEFWIGLFVPAQTPPDVVAQVYRESRKAMQTPQVQDRLARLGGEPMDMTQREFDTYMRDQIALNAALVKAAGIKPN